MKIENNKVVRFHYQLKEAEGEHIETSENGEAMAYLHGRGNIVTGLEEALEGKEAGDKLTVTLPPEKAYGPRQENAEQRIPIKHLLDKSKRYKVGQVVTVNTDQGHRQVQIVKVGKFNVDVDTNHPLAGITLEFTVDIQEVRDATAEEQQHGHAHGAGGHQH